MFPGASHTDPYSKRIGIIHSTLGELSQPGVRQNYYDMARRNLAHWNSAEGAAHHQGLILRVVSGDWGEVAGSVTREFGQTFAVLNMANAFTFGGGYLEGCPAQGKVDPKPLTRPVPLIVSMYS